MSRKDNNTILKFQIFWKRTQALDEPSHKPHPHGGQRSVHHQWLSQEFGHGWKKEELNEAAFTANPTPQRKTQRFPIIFPQLRQSSTHLTATFATNLPGALSWAWLNFLVAGVCVTQRLPIWCTHFSHFLDFCLVDVKKWKFTAVTKATLHWTVFSTIVGSGNDLFGELFRRTFCAIASQTLRSFQPDKYCKKSFLRQADRPALFH